MICVTSYIIGSENKETVIILCVDMGKSAIQQIFLSIAKRNKTVFEAPSVSFHHQRLPCYAIFFLLL